MKTWFAVLTVILAVAFLAPVRADETCGKTCKIKCKASVTSETGDDELLTLCSGDEGCKLIKISKDGKQQVIKLKDGKLLDFDDELDTEAHLKLLDAKIAYLKGSGQLRNDLAIKRVELRKIELAEKPDAEMTAKKKELNALEAKLKDKKLDYELAVKKLVPEGMHEFYMLDAGDDTSLLDLFIGLQSDPDKRVVKRIIINEDDEEEEDD